MDKNFVNIDNLVRQRLGGGEEQERSGAWLRMSELLDKEMPQEKAIGLFYWRRMLSAVAVLLLIAAISVGGYEFSASRKANLAANDAAVTPAPAPASTNITNAPVKNNEVINNQISTSGIADNSQANNDGQNDKKLLAANDTKPAHQQIAAITKTSTAQDIQNDQPKTINNNVNDGDNNHSANPVAKASPVKNAATHKAEIAKADAPGNKINNEDNNPSVVPVAKPAAAKKANNHKGETAKVTTPAQAAGINEAKPAITTAASVAKVSKDAPNNNRKKQAAAKTHIPTSSNAIVATKKAPQHKAVTGNASPNKVKTEKMDKLALSSHASVPNNAKPAIVSKQAIPNIAAKKTASAVTAVNSPAVAAKKKNTGALNANKVIAANTPPAKSGKPAGTNTKTTAVASAIDLKASAPANQPVEKGIPLAAAKPVADNTAMKEAYAINLKKGKRIIQKLVIFEHYIKTDPIDGHYDIDTISMKTITEELGMENENDPLSPSTASKTAARTSANTTAISNNNTAGEVAANGASQPANAQIVPGASANGKTTIGLKENATANKSGGSGSSTLGSLSAAFNDVKDKVTGMQFAAGLTGGINGTFFGPSSFKGFQFGVTGDFVFGNEWSFGTALEYFHRINSNYALNDNYYSYTPNQNGTYSKQLILNAYNFSTLHSLELPLIIRYTAGKFNLFVGGNLVYTFSINEGPSTLPDPTNVTTTTTKANDQTPKLDASDFNSRFGFGCLFGVSYKVAPNVTLDIRNVMTLWDNANSTGAKYVSDQLYKSPSIQLSLGYRLGGKKAK